MRITIFIGGVSGGGAERVICNLANYLVKKGHDIDILTMSDEPATYQLLNSINRVSLLTRKHRRSFLYNVVYRIISLIRYMKTNNRDCYLVVLPLTIIMLLLLKHLTTAKIIAAERGYPPYLPIFQQKMLRCVASKADGWVFQTEDVKRWYNDVIKNIKVKVIANAVNEDFIVPSYVGEKRNIIISIGRLSYQKNQSLLLYAFSKVVSKFPKYKLLIYGDGPNKELLENLIMKLNLQDNVSLVGYCQDILEKLQESSLFILSSRYEGMPNVLMEAMALGIPCISTDCDGGGARFLINNKENGLIVPKNDIDQLANAIDLLLSNPLLAYQLGKEAMKIRERLSPNVIYSEWENFIYEVVR